MCAGGGEREEIVRLLSAISTAKQTSSQPEKLLTVQELSAKTLIPAKFLRNNCGLSDTTDGVIVAYRLPGKSKVESSAKSVVLENGHIINGPSLYRCGDPLADQVVVLTQSAVDCWTIYYHGYPAIGVLEAKGMNDLSSEDFSGASKVIAIVKGGEDPADAYRGLLKLIQQKSPQCCVVSLRLPEGAMSLNALHIQTGGDIDRFEEQWQELLKEEKPFPAP